MKFTTLVFSIIAQNLEIMMAELVICGLFKLTKQQPVNQQITQVQCFFLSIRVNFRILHLSSCNILWT